MKPTNENFQAATQVNDVSPEINESRRTTALKVRKSALHDAKTRVLCRFAGVADSSMELNGMCRNLGDPILFPNCWNMGGPVEKTRKP
jgi:hypothetical protein